MIDKHFIKTLAATQGVKLDDAAAERLAGALRSASDALAPLSSHSLFDTEPTSFTQALEALGDVDGN
ncbi:MAG: hypothetical protein EXQ87_01295 [Alphaproteobacteria bacterium]|nr:hypothetical protein [Alphaproteobacteria bacterium]